MMHNFSESAHHIAAAASDIKYGVVRSGTAEFDQQLQGFQVGDRLRRRERDRLAGELIYDQFLMSCVSHESAFRHPPVRKT